jgi:L-ribulose-5-phosphate 4-epimerase
LLVSLFLCGFLEEGVIKFNLTWEKVSLGDFFGFKELNFWRQTLFSLGLIGAYENGVGYGNLSVRVPSSNSFVITGSATGNLSELSGEHYSKVTEFDFSKNWIKCEGEIKASSESLTHAAIYSALPKVNSVFHIHNKNLWITLIHKFPSTESNITYGTKEMAKSVGALVSDNIILKEKIFAMGGHEDGVVTFGDSVDAAGKALLLHYLPLL